MIRADQAIAPSVVAFVRNLRGTIDWDQHGIAVIHSRATKMHREAVCQGAIVAPDGAAVHILPLCAFAAEGIPLDGRALVMMAAADDHTRVFAVPIHSDTEAEEVGARLLGKAGRQ